MKLLLTALLFAAALFAEPRVTVMVRTVEACQMLKDFLPYGMGAPCKPAVLVMVEDQSKPKSAAITLHTSKRERTVTAEFRDEFANAWFDLEADEEYHGATAEVAR